jgi:hypothetical protein
VEKENFISDGLSKYVEFQKQYIEQNATLHNEDDSICGKLGRYFIAFVKIVVSSKFHSYGMFLAFKKFKL